MSQENVEIVRAAIDAWNREDWDAAFQDAAAGLEVDMSRAMGPASGVFNLDQAQRAYVEFAGNWESVRIEPHEFIEAGDLVVVPYTLYGKGRDGIEVAARPTNVWTIRNGAIERISMYQERQEALEAVGLSESPMSRENVEIARGVAEAFNRHDPEAALAWLAQDVEWHDLPDQPDAEVHHGHQDFLAAFEQFFAELEDYRVNLDETIDRGEQIVVCARITGRGRGSGARFEQPVVGVWTLRNGFVSRAVWFGTREEALEAVGVSE